MSETEKNESLQQMLVSFMKKLLGRDFVIMGLLVVGVAYFTLYSRTTLAQEIQKQVDENARETRAEIKSTRDELDRHMKEAAESKIYIQRFLNELAADNRAMYKTIQTGARQERLEKPLNADGGQ